MNEQNGFNQYTLVSSVLRIALSCCIEPSVCCNEIPGHCGSESKVNFYPVEIVVSRVILNCSPSAFVSFCVFFFFRQGPNRSHTHTHYRIPILNFANDKFVRNSKQIVCLSMFDPEQTSEYRGMCVCVWREWDSAEQFFFSFHFSHFSVVSISNGKK